MDGITTAVVGKLESTTVTCYRLDATSEIKVGGWTFRPKTIDGTTWLVAGISTVSE